MLPYSPPICQQLKTGNMAFCRLGNLIHSLFFKNFKYYTNRIKNLFKNAGDLFFDQITS